MMKISKFHKIPFKVDEDGIAYYDKNIKLYRNDYDRDGFSKWLCKGVKPIPSGSTKLSTLRYLSSKGFLYINMNNAGITKF